MNVIYIKASDKHKLIDEFQKMINGEDNPSKVYTFYKKDTRVKNILNDIFPIVLTPIIINYYKETILVAYSFAQIDYYADYLLTQYLSVIIIKDFQFSIIFTARPGYNFYNKETVLGSNFVMQPRIESDIFGIDEESNPFIWFNHFMLKYYNKKRYFDNFFVNNGLYSDIKPKFKNMKKLKHYIIIIKILTDIIQHTKFNIKQPRKDIEYGYNYR